MISFTSQVAVGTNSRRDIVSCCSLIVRFRLLTLEPFERETTSPGCIECLQHGEGHLAHPRSLGPGTDARRGIPSEWSRSRHRDSVADRGLLSGKVQYR